MITEATVWACSGTFGMFCFVGGIALTLHSQCGEDVRNYFRLRTQMLRSWPSSPADLELRHKAEIAGIHLVYADRIAQLNADTRAVKRLQTIPRYLECRFDVKGLVERELSGDILPLFGARKGSNVDGAA